MKRITFILASLLVLSFGLASGQTGQISIDPVSGLFEGKIPTGSMITFEIRFTNDYTAPITGSTNGFQLSSPDGAVWTNQYSDADIIIAIPDWPFVDTIRATDSMAVEGAVPGYDGGVFINPFSWDGELEDTVGFGGFKISASGIVPGFDAVVMLIGVTFDHSESGKTFCMDTAFYPPTGAWMWSSSPDTQPLWESQECWELYEVPNLPPVWVDCPASLGDNSHCAVIMHQFVATDDPQDETQSNPITYELLAGPGSIDALSGMWSYAPSLVDVGSYVLTIKACDALGACTAAGTDHPHCDVNFDVSNIGPAFTSGCDAVIPVGKGNTGYAQMTAADGDCDPITFSIVSVTPTPVGTYDIDPSTGLITFNTDESDAPAPPSMLYTFVVAVSDGPVTVECDVFFDVLFTEPYQVRIEKTHLTIQGGHETVDIILEAGSETMGGFDFLLAYDASALTFVGAMGGDIFAECDWEYFTYRFGAYGNCDGGCPSGLLRVVGIAETNNGTPHPDCFFMEKPFSLATLDFLVSDDRTLECQYVPIRFFWFDCGDNTISSQSGDSLFISKGIYDFDLGGELTGVAPYPTYTGAQDVDCFVDPFKRPIRFIDFYNGGIDIACADDLDARGDVNLNEIGYEIADAVLFSNYFVYGLGVFDNIPGQVAATDVNADGLTLSVADLVYLIRVIVGDALPYPKLNPEVATYSVDNGTIRVNSDMGAAALVIEGNTVPTLLADNMEMRYNFDGTNTRVLVYSMEEGAKFSGNFMNVNGEVVSLEMANYDGTPIAAKVIPANYSLKQNYPNPFNPATSISLDIAKAGDYSLTIYNVTGQKVAEFSDFAEAGTVTVRWDASDMASGVYFYKLNTGNFTDTKKMVLLK